MDIEITLALAKEFVVQQFPQYAHLPIQLVECRGWNNDIFRWWDTLSIRLPRAEKYAVQVEKAQEWLLRLAPHLSVQIPEPITLEKSAPSYPWPIYPWIEGRSANLLNPETWARARRWALWSAGFGCAD